MAHAKVDRWATSGGSNLPTPVTTAETFPFLQLTSELRIDIYRLLYQRESQIWLTGHLAHHCGRDRIDTGLLLACRKIYNEASAVLYDTNTFAVNGRAGSRVILERLGTQACSYLKTLRIWSIPLQFFELERQFVCPKAQFPSLYVNCSVWDCVSLHLKKLQKIELGIFRDDFFTAVARLTSSVGRLDRGRPPPTIELALWESASTSTPKPITSALGPGGGLHAASWEMSKTLLLPSITLIRLTGRLNSSDRNLLQQNIYPHYAVDNVEELDMSDFPDWRTPYRDESAVLITLIKRGESLYAPSLSREEVDQQDEMVGLGDGEVPEKEQKRDPLISFETWDSQ
jgi:hypothetical protein